ncbi:hypothetical protein QBC34DRAFT_413164 [Podospora aff. communis PSN243]|uniref:Uncharacterized protein n=1 Tax=Podospora aff. communis PSN243 TaxID=3040156 RepID=A0AAV9GBA6_9PEZI|nr:hypothetical protein QBC34DRAFT_413164 [Podospora aff. communis PSN243]
MASGLSSLTIETPPLHPQHHVQETIKFNTMDVPIDRNLHIIERMNSPSLTDTKFPPPRQIPRQPDSGYATQINTAFASPVTKRRDSTSQQSQDEFAHNGARSVPMPGREDLQIVRRDIDYTCNARFREIAPTMQLLLHRSLQKWTLGFPSVKAKSKRTQMTMSLRLMVVGATAETAKPSIVIFLAGHQTRNLEIALQTDELKRLYRSDDGVTPSFDVIVVGQEPKRRSRREVSVTWDASRVKERDLSTLCGLRVSLDAGGGNSAVATIGGIVKLTYGPGDFKLAAMTAGHLLGDLLDMDPNDDGADTEMTTFTDPRSFGTISHPAIQNSIGDEQVLIPKRDWALIDIDPLIRIRPNLIPKTGSAGRVGVPTKSASLGLPLDNWACMTAAPPDSFPSAKPIEVTLLSDSCSSRFSGARLGLLSHMPGAIMLSPEDGFIDACLLTLDDGQELHDGDSGSWVVNPISLEVYGHLVATDVTGDGYIIPLHAVLDEMKAAMEVQEVSLPGTADLLDAALLQDLRKARVLDDGDSGYVSMASAIPGKETCHAEGSGSMWGDDDGDDYNCW